MATAEITTKRIHETARSEDGCRVLVDGMWPRGIKKADAALDHWFKGLAPTAELRRWFGHDPAKWQTFREHYHAELAANPDALAPLRELTASEKRVTLLFAARDTEHNNAVALAEYLRKYPAA